MRNAQKTKFKRLSKDSQKQILKSDRSWLNWFLRDRDRCAFTSLVLHLNLFLFYFSDVGKCHQYLTSWVNDTKKEEGYLKSEPLLWIKMSPLSHNQMVFTFFRMILS